VFHNIRGRLRGAAYRLSPFYNSLAAMHADSYVIERHQPHGHINEAPDFTRQREPRHGSVDDFAARHGISRGYLYELWKRGEGPAYIQLGKRRFVTKDAGAAWRKSLEKTAKATKAAA
jgi:hypothetical protein